MRQWNFLFIFLMVAMVAMAGCKIESTSPCEGLTAEESYICQVIPNPQTVGFMLRLANAGAIDSNLYKAEEALKVIDSLIAFTGGEGVTYASLYARFMEVSPTLFVVVDEYKDQFIDADILIKPTDMDMINTHLTRQRSMLLMVLNSRAENSLDNPTMCSSIITGTGGGDRSCNNETGIILASGGAGY